MEEFFKNGGSTLIAYSSILFFSLLQIRLRKATSRAQIIEIFLVHLMGISGFNGMVAFYWHTAQADWIATNIGWPTGSPFQTEMAFANLATGVIAFLVFFRRDFILPAIIAGGILGVGAGITHVIDLLGRGNFAPFNAGPTLYMDFIGPALRVGLYIVYARALAPGKLPEAHAGWYT